MGRRGLRVGLIVMLLAMTMASFGAAGAAEGTGRAVDRDSLRLDAIEGTGLTKFVLPDRRSPAELEARWREYRDMIKSPQVVVGEDSRIQITDTTIFPYSAIAQLVGLDASLPEDYVTTCTASFVGAKVLLTAAHCLWDQAELGGWIDELLIVPGANGDQIPFGVLQPESLWIPDGYTTNSEPGSPYDYALIVLSNGDVEEQTGSFEVGILTTAELQDPNLNPTTAGYPGDKPDGTQWISSDGGFTSVDGDGLIHNIDSIQGQSGSPVWRASDMAVIGVESAESDVENLAVRLDIPIMYEFMQVCQELGCRINHFLSDIPGDGDAYDRVWSRTDQPVAAGAEARTWMWGPSPISKVMFEPYTEAPNGFRTVLYQEKSRMEITTPDADPNSIWYVTNGLATVELMTGRLQLGNDTFEEHDPAEINVAGDGDDPNGPTYRTFASLQSLPPHGGVPTAGTSLTGNFATITATVDRDGNVGDDPSLAAQGVTAAHYVPETQHMVASVFWEFMNSSGTVWQDGQYVTAPLFDNAFFATGFPVTEAYWTTVRVGGTERTLLVQAFQRRVLTYTPGNPQGFLVEAGNVGAHYLQWLEAIIEAEEAGGGGGEPTDDAPPGAGDLIAAYDLSLQPELDFPIATGLPIEGGYQITHPPTGFWQFVSQDSFGDGYFALDVRLVQPSDFALGCVLVRAAPNVDTPIVNDAGYWVCLVYEGNVTIGVSVIYETPQGLQEIAGWQFVDPLPGDQWHEIGVVALGQKFWPIVDGGWLGPITHDIGPASGLVGTLTFNLTEVEGQNVTFQLRDLEVYGLVNQ